MSKMEASLTSERLSGNISPTCETFNDIFIKINGRPKMPSVFQYCF